MFPSISLCCSLRKALFSLLAFLWKSAFKWVYLSFSPLIFTSLLFTAICNKLHFSQVIPCYFEVLPWVRDEGEVAVSMKVKSESGSIVSNSLRPHGLYSLWNSLGQNTRVGSLSFLQGICPTQGSNPGLLHCRQILHHLSHLRSPSWRQIRTSVF